MSQIKRCPACENVLPLSAFNYRDKEHKRIQSYCRDCSNTAWRAWYSDPANKKHHLALLKRRRQRRIRENKALVRELKSVPCADCGERFPVEAMDFDHIDDKEDLISKLVYTAGRERLMREIAKCEVVCSNCHRVRTTRRINDRLAGRAGRTRTDDLDVPNVAR